MDPFHRLALLTLVALLGLVAPAQATLLVRSDGNGLLVQDKNGLNDLIIIFSPSDSPGAYGVTNSTIGDVFRFDRQAGCRETPGGSQVRCDRNGARANYLLAGGNDDLNMAGAPVGDFSVAGGTGNDTVLGHPGRDVLNGQTGEDELDGRAGNDSLDGAENADRLEGGDGNDTLLGEGNADVLIGEKGDDVHRGGAGNDFINSKEPVGTVAVDDAVDCGNGFDRVEADLKDSVQADCEEIEEGAVGETPNVVIRVKTLRVSRIGGVRVRLRCPRGVGSLGCNGRLQLKVGGAQASRSRRVRYRIRAGRRKTVALRLTRSDVRRLRGRRRRGVLTSVEKGRKGPKTTILNPRLRLR